jgi:hypothetical protein
MKSSHNGEKERQPPSSMLPGTRRFQALPVVPERRHLDLVLHSRRTADARVYGLVAQREQFAIRACALAGQCVW